MRISLPTTWGTLAGPDEEIARLHRKCQYFKTHSPEAFAMWIHARIDAICGLWRVELETPFTVEVQAERIFVSDPERFPTGAHLNACWVEDTQTIRISAKYAGPKELIHELAHAVCRGVIGEKLPGRMGEILAINAMQEII